MNRERFLSIINSYSAFTSVPKRNGSRVIIPIDSVKRIELEIGQYDVEVHTIVDGKKEKRYSVIRFADINKCWFSFHSLPYLVIRTGYPRRFAYIPFPGMRKDWKESVLSGSPKYLFPAVVMPDTLKRLTDGEKVTVYTDGSCVNASASSGRGDGGWTFSITIAGDEIFSKTGLCTHVTSWEMEILAVIRALEKLEDCVPESILVVSDYKEIADIMRGRRALDYSSFSPKAVMYRRLNDVVKRLNCPVRWRWVKGHNGNKGNERCDMRLKAKMKNKKQTEL